MNIVALNKPFNDNESEIFVTANSTAQPFSKRMCFLYMNKRMYPYPRSRFPYSHKPFKFTFSEYSILYHRYFLNTQFFLKME